MKITLFNDKRTGAMYIRVAHNYARSLVPIHLDVEPDRWRTGRVPPQMSAALSEYLNDAKMAVLRLAEVADLDTLTAHDIARHITDTRRSTTATAVLFLDHFSKFGSSRTAPNTRQIYASTLHRIEAYSTTAHLLRFEDITRQWLDAFTHWLMGNGCTSLNAIGIHLRNIRAAFNDAISAGITQHYPFRGYHIPSAETPSRALTAEEVAKLITTDAEGIDLEARDVFALSFFLGGMNLADIFALTPDSIHGNRIVYRRKKTGKMYSLPITEPVGRLLDAHRCPTRLVLMCERYSSTHTFTVCVNRRLRALWGKHITSYHARHSWASIAINECGVSMDVVARVLGHTSAHRTTAIYARLGTQAIDDACRKVAEYIEKKCEV